MIFRRCALILLALTALSSAPAYAIDGMSLEIGNGDGVDMGRVGVQWDWKKRWFQGANWHLGGYWESQPGTGSAVTRVPASTTISSISG